MKTLKYFSLILLLAIVSVSAQAKSNDVIYVKAEKFTLPLVEKWVAEFSQANPNTSIKLTNSDQEADIKLVLKSDEDQSNNNVVFVGRYALLPVANNKNQALDQLTKTKLNKKVIKDLFFENDFPDTENKKIAKLKASTTVYSGNKATSGSVFFANYFGQTASDLRDKRISGDDLFLLNAIEKDETGITINNLAYLYDLKTRKLKDNLVILPLDLKKEYSEVLASADLDQTIDLLESQKIDLIPVNQFGFETKDSKPAVSEFLGWVLKNGQQYNQDFGFLSLDQSTLVAQEKNVSKNYLTSNITK